MDEIVSPTTTTTIPYPIASTPVEDDGFYTNIPPIMADKTFHMTPDRKSLIIGFSLGIITIILLGTGLVFAIKLYRRKVKKQVEKEKCMEEQQQWIIVGGDDKLSIPLSTSGTSKKSHLSSLLDPGSQFSLAVQRASEIPNSPPI